MRRRFFSLTVAAALAVVPLSAAAQISPGIQLSGTIDQNISSGNAQIGGRVTVSNVHSQDNDINGAVLYGHVTTSNNATDVQVFGQPRPGRQDRNHLGQAPYALRKFVRHQRAHGEHAGQHEKQYAQ